MPELPHGTVTFLFTDIAGSTRLWRDHRAAMEQAYARHDALLREAITAHRGVVYKVIGDALQVAFPSAPEAVAAALEAQFGLDLEPWPLPEPLRVRMALHAGDVDPEPDGDYRSPVLNRLGRLLGVGYGGQVLLSHAVRGLSHERLPEDAGLLDLGEHRLKDLLEPEHLYQLVHPGLPSDFPPLKTLDQRRHNLPLQPTPFLGRETEVARVVERLQDPGVRLLTLTGPGGMGKTRLALQAAAEVVEAFPDGVWFVPLAPLSDPALVPSAIASALGVREEGGRSLSEALGDFLREKRLLLVLDNFEQVITAAPPVAELIAVAPGLTVLVTSRAPLRLQSEREHPVPPLGLPRRKPPPTLEQLGQYEAVRLFISRAQAVKPDFAITNQSAPAVAELCWRLDGLPLAIELAAARVRVLSPQTMLRRLEQRLPLLTGGARDAPARQQTLRGAIAWSYDLLEPDEQKLFRRLSIFAGGWTLEAAEAVAGSPGSGELGLDVLEGLERLVQHSLVRQEEGLGGECRYQMLETIREYGVDELASAGEAQEAHQRHAAFFLKLTETAEPAMMIGRIADRWSELLEIEQANLQAALGWTGAHEPETALRLAGALVWFWWHRGILREGRDWLEQALHAAPGAPAAQRAKALDGAGMLAWSTGLLDEAETLYERALATAIAAGDAQWTAHAVQGMAVIVEHQGDQDRAHELYERALDLARNLGDQRWLAIVLYNTANQANGMGDDTRVETLLNEGVVIARTFGPSGLLGAYLGGISELRWRQGDHQGARSLLRESLELSRSAGNQMNLVSALAALGRWTAEHYPDRAARWFGAVHTFQELTGSVLSPMDVVGYETGSTVARERLGESLFTTAWEAGRALSLEEAVSEALALADEVTTAPCTTTAEEAPAGRSRATRRKR